MGLTVSVPKNLGVDLAEAAKELKTFEVKNESKNESRETRTIHYSLKVDNETLGLVGAAWILQTAVANEVWKRT